MESSPTRTPLPPLPQPPKDPSRIIIHYAIPLPLVCVTPGAMMTLARNWGVLGRPKWTGRTILGALLIHAGILLGLVLTVLGVHFLLGWSFIWAFGIGNLVFWIAIRDLQTGAYAAWVTTRDPERMRGLEFEDVVRQPQRHRQIHFRVRRKRYMASPIMAISASAATKPSG